MLVVSGHFGAPPGCTLPALMKLIREPGPLRDRSFLHGDVKRDGL